MSVRSRSIPFQGGCSGTLTTKSRLGNVDTISGGWSPPTLQGSQVTVSENHPEWRKRAQEGALTDIGGSFSSTKRYAYCLPEAYRSFIDVIPVRTTQTIVSKYRGPVTALGHVAEFPPALSSSELTLDAWGAKAIAACKPTNSKADASVFLGEIFKEGLPQLVGSTLWRDRTRSALKKGSSEYLNVEFGWKPIANDIRKFYYGVKNADTILQQYRRDAGRVVRRRYDFPPVVSQSEMLINDQAKVFTNPSSSYMFADPSEYGKVYRIHKQYTKRWFSGAFTYYMPVYESAVLTRMSQQYGHVLGLELTPETVWNLSPWTWALDWVSNLGSVISNASDYASDGLVLRYGYIMEHSINTYIYTWAGKTGLRSKALPSDVILVTETKQRRKATPFGFGLTWDGLSPRQLAIAAALGINKS